MWTVLFHRFKVRDNGKIINKTVYLCVGLKQNGLKEVLGMWVWLTLFVMMEMADVDSSIS